MSGRKELLYRSVGVLACFPVGVLLALLITWMAHAEGAVAFFIGVGFGVLATCVGDVLGSEVYHRRWWR